MEPFVEDPFEGINDDTSQSNFRSFGNVMDDFFDGVLHGTVTDADNPLIGNGLTLLHIASVFNRSDVVKWLHEQNVDMDISDSDGLTALDYAVKNDSSDALKTLIECGAHIETNVKDMDAGSTEEDSSHFVGRKECSRSALFVACKRNKTDMAKMLIEFGADVNISDDKLGGNALYHAVVQGNVHLIGMLLDNGADINNVDKAGNAPLRYTPLVKDVPTLQLLLNRGASHVCDTMNRTLLHVAALEGDVQLVEYLVRKEFCLDSADLRGWTALHSAAFRGHENVIRALISHGANIEFKNKNGWTPMIMAANCGQLAAVEVLLDAGASVDPEDCDEQGWLFDKELMTRKQRMAFDYGNVLESRYMTNIPGGDGMTKDGLAQFFDLKTIFHSQLMSIATEFRKTNTSPLMEACKEGHTTVARLLLQRGANINKRFLSGNVSILRIAILQNHVDIVTLLLEHDVEIDEQEAGVIAQCLKETASVKMAQLLADDGAIEYGPYGMSWTAAVQQCFPCQTSFGVLNDYSVMHLNRKCANVTDLFNSLKEQNMSRAIFPIIHHPIFLLDATFQLDLTCSRNSNEIVPIVKYFSGLNTFSENFVEFFMYLSPENAKEFVKHFPNDRNEVESKLDAESIFVTVTYGKYNAVLTKWTTYFSVTVAVKENLPVELLLKSIKDFIICFNMNQINKAGSNSGEKYDCFKRKKIEQELLLFWTSDEKELDPNRTVGDSALIYNPFIRVFSRLDKRSSWLGQQWQDDFFNDKIKELMYQEMAVINPMMRDDPVLCMLLSEAPSVADARKLIHHYYPRVRSVILFDKQNVLADDTMLNEVLKGGVFFGIIWQFKEERFERKKLLGRGSFGCVYCCKVTRRLNEFALKEMEKKTKKLKEDFISEIITLAVIGSHPFIVPYSHLYEDEKKLYIRMPLMQTSLSTFIKHRKNETKVSGALGENEIFIYSEQILSGLYFLHKNGIVHMDLSGGNVLMESEYKVKISDFGLSKFLATRPNLTAGRSRYMPPEALIDNVSSVKADIWSYGAVLIEMMTGELPHGDMKSPKAIKFTINNKTILYEPHYQISNELKSFVDWCIKADPRDRPSCVDLMKHPFFCRENSFDEA